MKNEKINYYLVLEKRLGDYNIIDINRLDITNKEISNDILAIDFFTCKFTNQEIIDSIIRSNMARPEYLDSRLRIISDARHKHNLTVLTKEIYQDVMDFQTNEEEMDQNFKNKLFGAYKKIVESSFNDPDFIKTMLDRFKTALRNGTKREMFKLIAELPYQKSRNIYISIYKVLNRDELINDNKKNVDNPINENTYRASYNNQNKRILEKLNDVA